MSAFGALQDWDGITFYCWCQRLAPASLGCPPTGFDNCFNHDRHPLKLVTMPFGALAFRRGDVAPAAREPPSASRSTIEKQWLLDGRRQPGDLWSFRIAGRKGDLARRLHPSPRFCPGSDQPVRRLPRAESQSRQSDNGELLCDVADPARGVLTVNAPRPRR